MALLDVHRVLLEETSATRLGLVAIAIAYISWRLWTFTLRPALRPDEPKQVPYSIPFLGHALTFFRDSNKACRDARLSMGNTQEPLGMVIAGEQFYIINSSEDVTSFYNNKKTLSFDEYVSDVLIGMGCSQEGVERMNKIQPHLNKSLVHAGEDFYRSQFMPGQRFNHFWPAVYNRIESRLGYERLLADSSSTHSLWELCRSALLGPTLASIFGNAVLETDPAIIDTMVEFDDLSWKINYKVPMPFSKDVHAAKNKMIEFFVMYARLPDEAKADASWFARSLEEEMQQAGLTERDVAVFNVSVSWTALSNAFKGCFWLMAHILYEPGLFEAIQTEVREADLESLHDSESALELAYPQLISLYNETLRHSGSSVSIRTAISPTRLGRFTIPSGSRIILPTRQLHMNERSFAHANEFKPDRFRDPKLSKSPSFRPFGGGVSYCPGRYLARRELVLFVVLLLNRFDVKLDDGSLQKFPKLDEIKPSVGVLTPQPGDDVFLILKRRSS